MDDMDDSDNIPNGDDDLRRMLNMPPEPREGGEKDEGALRPKDASTHKAG